MGISMMPIIDKELIDTVVRCALDEDLGAKGDSTSDLIFGVHDQAIAEIKSKAAGRLSGTELIGPVFARIDPRVSVDLHRNDGSELEPGALIASVAGPSRALFAGERTVLNFLQHLSGIASQTQQFARKIAHTGAMLLDTRKTTPSLRLLEKKAVRDGGGTNHRMGLYDMVLIKDTHIAAAGGIGAALAKVRSHIGVGSDTKVEIEVRTFEELVEALGGAPDRVMLDNMTPRELKECVGYVRSRNGRVELEASGNVNLDTIAGIAETGVDFVSVGSITHSAPALDIHMIVRC